MRRRELIVGLGGAAAWPALAWAQQSAMPVIGFLGSTSPDTFAKFVAAFREGLSEAGYVEGQNVRIEFRWAEGRYERLPFLASDLVSHGVMVIATSGGEPSALAAKSATSTVPIVFVGGGDPIKLGLAASLNRPGGNVTGITLLTPALGAKRLEFIKELVPKAAVIALLVNPTNPNMAPYAIDIAEAARSLGQKTAILNATSERELDQGFATFTQKPADALVVIADPLFTSRHEIIVNLASRYAIPAIYPFREYAVAGGLMSYGPSFAAAHRQAGSYVGRILKGSKAADLPIEQPAKFEFVINLKTAKALGLTVPPTLLTRADEVIE